MSRFDLKTPCKNCPFRTDEAAIRFYNGERAAEISESAYRNGFPCHLSAENLEDDDEGEGGGFVFGENTQHCAGAIIMFLHDGWGGSWPGIGNDDALAERLALQMNMEAPVFENEEDFIAASARPSPTSEEATTKPSHSHAVRDPSEIEA
tara:strand:+ start:45684 stop:46133 length:450 start_codon:yes stop_codon:yes gene_type:complete